MANHPSADPPGSPVWTGAHVWSWRLPRRRLPLVALAARSSPRIAAAERRLEIEPVALLAGVVLPPPPLVVAVGRVSLPPGAAVAATTAGGARLVAAEAGTVTVKVVGEGVTRPPNGVPPFGPPQAGPKGQVRLRPGSALTVAAEVVREVRNDGAETALALDVAVFPGGARPLAPSVTTADGVVFTLLAGGVAAELPPGPVQIFLRRVVLPPRRALPRGLAEGIAVLHLEAGAATLRPVAGGAFVTEAWRWPRVGEAGEPRPLAVGTEVALLPGGGAFVPYEGDAEVRAGVGGATMLVLTVHASAVQPLAAVGS